MFIFSRLCVLFALMALLPAGKSKGPAVANPTRPYYVIAHRGGVVDSTNAENSQEALEGAIRRGYDMVEIDMRVTKDHMLLINHDKTFKRYYGVDSAVSDMTWDRIRQLEGAKGSRVLSLEKVFDLCHKGHLGVMIDNKFEGYDPVLFDQVLALLKKYGLQKEALMIGTDSSTAYFTGKVRLSCTRRQLEDNLSKAGYDPSHYYLFGGVKELTAGDVTWAKQKDIMVVAAVNIYTYRQRPDYLREAARDIDTLKARGVTCFQVDSNFDDAFFGSR